MLVSTASPEFAGEMLREELDELWRGRVSADARR